MGGKPENNYCGGRGVVFGFYCVVKIILTVGGGGGGTTPPKL